MGRSHLDKGQWMDWCRANLERYAKMYRTDVDNMLTGQVFWKVEARRRFSVEAKLLGCPTCVIAWAIRRDSSTVRGMLNAALETSPEEASTDNPRRLRLVG